MSKRQKPSWIQARELASKRKIVSDEIDKYFRNEYTRGYNDGIKESLPQCMQLANAAAILAFKREVNDDNDACEKFLLTFADILTNEIDSEEAADKVFDETGIRIHADQAVDIVEHKEE